VRNRPLLFMLAVILVGAATPLSFAFDIALVPMCLFPANPRGTTEIADTKPIRAHQAAPTYTLEERDYLIRTVAFEAPHETNKGKAAVAHVILNRKKSGRWGDNVKDVVTRPWQFEPWMTRRKEMEELSPNDPRYQSAARIADGVLAGQIPDPTAGATHFLNPIVVRQRRGGSLPSWASGEGLSIGRHAFYSPAEAGAAPQSSAMSLIAIARAIFMQHAQSCRSELAIP
jgi:spore germination cell wall hydrolase CwlJ-like protein